MLKPPHSRFTHVRRCPFLSVRTSIWTVAPLCFFQLYLLQGCGGGASSSSPPISSALAVSTSTLAGGTVSTAYSVTLAATGGTGSGYAWSAPAGGLPAGLTLAAAGLLSGTPTTPGSFTFQAEVTDSSGASAIASLNLVIAGSGPLTTYEFTGDTS